MAGLLDYLEGIGETGATLGTGLLSGVVGAPYGLFKGITSGRYGSPEAVRIAEEEAKKFMERNTYVPRGKVAQEALSKAAQLMEASKLPPILPEAAMLGSIPRQAYLAQAERRGMDLERAMAPRVERMLERGGAGADVLRDLAQGTRSNVIDHPFLKPSIALSNNPYSGLSGPDKTNMSRYIKKMKDPGFAAREIMRETGSTQMTKTADTTPNIISPVDMYRGGEPLVPVAGDTTRAGVQYTNINGVPLAVPVDMQGGFQYPIIQSKIGSPNVWASLDSAAMGKQAHFNKVAEQTNLTPRGVFFSMNPKDSPDFSTHISELIMGQIPALNPSAQAFKEANAIVQSKFPNFLGFDNPGAMAQIMDKDAGQLRKQIAFAAKQKRIEQLGFPSYDDIIQAANHPMLANAKVGDSGLSTFFGLPGASLNPIAGHNTYNRGIIGAEAGSLPVSIPVQNMFPSIFQAAGLRRNKSGNLLNADEKAGVVKMSHQFQMPDQEWLDQIMPIYEAELARQRLSGGLLSSFP